jgi:tripartite-type tricarboxylate transporter receptor subunit TctC
VRAADYPERNIRVVVPFAAAGTTNIVTRILFEEISGSMGSTIIVDNRPGAGGAQGTTDLLTGRIHFWVFWVAPIPTRLNEIRDGRLRALAVAGNERSPDLPNIPTVSETGFGPFDASTAYAVFAPRGVSGAIQQRLHSEIGAALRSKEVSQKLRSAGVEPQLSAPEEVTHLLVGEIDQWALIIRSAGIQIRE